MVAEELRDPPRKLLRMPIGSLGFRPDASKLSSDFTMAQIGTHVFVFRK